MCKLRLFAAMTMIVAVPGLALAQAGTEGPLAAPDMIAVPAKEARPTNGATPKMAKHKHKKIAHHDASQPRDGFATGGPTPSRELALRGSGAAPADPLSFGMKWNGNSDNARETRIQNYDANAPGSGAEVGMKLHF